MSRVFNRSPLIYILALALFLGVTIGMLTATSSPTTASGKDFGYRGQSEPPQPLPALSGRIVRITEEVTRSPREGAFPGDDSWVTVTWAEIDEQGAMARFRSVTSGADGEIRQDQLYELGSEVVNDANWMGTGQACSETLAIGAIGSGIPTLDADSLASRGFELVAEVDGVETWTASGPVASGYQSTTQEVFRNRAKGYDLGSRLTGKAPNGSSAVIYSRRVTIDQPTAPTTDPFAMEPLGPCPGHAPTQPDGEVK